MYGLDFTIEKLPMVAKRPEMVVGEGGVMSETLTDVPTGYFGLLNSKSGNIINTVKQSYHVTQNADVLDLTLQGMKGFGELSINKAGSMNDGRKVYIQLGIEGNAKVGNDTIKRNVTIIDSNDGSTGLSVGVGDFTMSCSNQFFYFRKQGQFKFRHTATLADKVKTLPAMIQEALGQSLRLMELYNKFQSTSVSRDLAHDLVNHLLGIDKRMTKSDMEGVSTRKVNAMETLYANIEKEMNSKGNNLWGLHSGTTRWTTHEKSHPTRENGQIESLMIGTNARTNIASLDFAKSIMG
jgi:hypothetical protein